MADSVLSVARRAGRTAVPRALVTGASSGLGREIAIQLAVDYGFAVTLVGRDPRELRRTKDAIERNASPDASAESEIEPVDVSRPEQVEALAKRRPDVDLLALCASQNLFARAIDPEVGDASFELLRTNVDAPLRLLRAYAASLERRRGGLISVASVAGFLPCGYEALYHATKAYQWSLFEGVRAERPGFLVTNVTVGPFRSQMAKRSGLPVEGPAWIRSSPETVARRILRGHERGHGIVAPDWQGRIARALYGASPFRLLERAQLRIFERLIDRKSARSPMGPIPGEWPS